MQAPTLATGSADTTICIWEGRGNPPQFQNVNTLRGHKKLVYALVAVDSNYLASSSMDWTIRIWDVDAGSCIHVMKGHDEAITSLAAFLSPTGQALSPMLVSSSKVREPTATPAFSLLKDLDRMPHVSPHWGPRHRISALSRIGSKLLMYMLTCVRTF